MPLVRAPRAGGSARPAAAAVRHGEAEERVRFPLAVPPAEVWPSPCAGQAARRAPACSGPRAPPTCDAIVRRGFSSADSSLGISFITMATALSAALAPFPYNSEINNGASQQRAGQPPRPNTPQNRPDVGGWNQSVVESRIHKHRPKMVTVTNHS